MGRAAVGSDGSQSGLRVIVLFTDGASNSVPGDYPAQPGVAKGCERSTSRRTCPIPTARPGTIRRSTDSTTPTPGASSSPGYNVTVANWNDTTIARRRPWLPLTSWHTHHRSGGHPDVISAAGQFARR